MIKSNFTKKNGLVFDLDGFDEKELLLSKPALLFEGRGVHTLHPPVELAHPLYKLDVSGEYSIEAGSVIHTNRKVETIIVIDKELTIKNLEPFWKQGDARLAENGFSFHNTLSGYGIFADRGHGSRVAQLAGYGHYPGHKAIKLTSSPFPVDKNVPLRTYFDIVEHLVNGMCEIRPRRVAPKTQ